MSNRVFWDSSFSFGLSISDVHIKEILQECRRQIPNETGGILIGTYQENNSCAKVTAISGPPKDSKHGSTWFYRGTKGLLKLLDKHWEKHGHYYLGEWHFHPYTTPTPSFQDIFQMKSIAKSSQYNCPEPILLIVGGDPDEVWTMKATVFPSGQEYIRLEEQ